MSFRNNNMAICLEFQIRTLEIGRLSRNSSTFFRIGHDARQVPSGGPIFLFGKSEKQRLDAD